MNTARMIAKVLQTIGKNVERLFTDCARFLYNKYHDKLGEVGHNGDLSSDNDSFHFQLFESVNHTKGGQWVDKVR